MGHRLRGRGATPRPPSTGGAAGAEGDKQQYRCGEAGPDTTPLRFPGPQEAPLGQYLVLWGSLALVLKERATFLNVLDYCLKTLLPVSPVPPTAVPIFLLGFPFTSGPLACPRWKSPRHGRPLPPGPRRGRILSIPSSSESGRECGTFSFYFGKALG